MRRAGPQSVFSKCGAISASVSAAIMPMQSGAWQAGSRIFLNSAKVARSFGHAPACPDVIQIAQHDKLHLTLAFSVRGRSLNHLLDPASDLVKCAGRIGIPAKGDIKHLAGCRHLATELVVKQIAS